MQAATEPVFISKKTKTMADVTRTDRDFLARQFLEGYQLRGARSPEYDTLAEGMISNWIAANPANDTNANLPSLAAPGDLLAKDTNCTDPLVLTFAGLNATELREGIRRLDRAVTGFQNSKHLAYPKFFAAVALTDKEFEGGTNRIPALDAQGLAWLQEAFTDGSLRPEDQEVVAESLIHGWARNFFLRHPIEVYGIVNAQGDQYQWLALVLQGENEINAAWASRGGGYADSVTATGWQGFYDDLARARNSLNYAWHLDPDRPQAPDLMITVSLGNSDINEMRTWFDRTVSAQLDYADAWHEMRWGLRPRWFGDINSMLAFGRTALNTRRFDTDVPRVYLASVADAEDEMGLATGQQIYGQDNIWPDLETMYLGYIAGTNQTGAARDNWQSRFAVTAYLAGKYDVAQQQLQALNWQPDPSALTGWYNDLSLMPMEVAARTGAQSNLVAVAEDHRQDGEIADALNIYDQLAKSSDLDSLTRSFVRERQYSLNLEEQLQTGKWISFLPADNQFIGWQTNFGAFEVLPDGSLEVHADENGHMMYCRARVGTEFEIRGTYDVVNTSSGYFQGGVVMGLPQFENFNWYAFRVKRNASDGDAAAFSQHWSRQQVMVPLNNLDSHTNSFDFRFQHGFATASVNGQQILDEIPPPESSYVTTNEFYVGLGAFNYSDSTVIRYHDVEIRSLANQ
jgi:hypothetical protein